MILKIEIPNHVLLHKDDEIVIKFTERHLVSCSIHPNGATRIHEDDVTQDSACSTKDVRLFDFVAELVAELKQQRHLRLTETYECATRKFLLFCHREDILLNDIDGQLLCKYEAYLKQNGLTLNTISFYMRILRAIYNKAVGKGLLIDKKPFAKVFTKIPQTSKRAIPLKILQKLFRAEIKNSSESFARDLFLFSFYMRGMSFIDIAFLKKSDIKGSHLIYKRNKTGQELKIAWRKEMQDIVNKHSSLDGLHLLGILDANSTKSLRSQYHYKQCLVNEALKRLAKHLKIEAHLTMYVARHSWATLAKELNIPLNVISDGMGHHSEKTTQIYLKSIDADIIDQSNAQLIAAVTQENR